MPLCLNCKKMLKDADFARGWMKSCQNQIWLKSTPLDRWWRQCSVICSEKSDRRELITREMIYSRIFIPCHSHQICAINELCGDRSIAKNLPKILTNSRLCLLLCNAVYKFQMPDLLWKVLPALFWCQPWRGFHASVALFHFDRFCCNSWCNIYSLCFPSIFLGLWSVSFQGKIRCGQIEGAKNQLAQSSPWTGWHRWEPDLCRSPHNQAL